MRSLEMSHCTALWTGPWRPGPQSQLQAGFLEAARRFGHWLPWEAGETAQAPCCKAFWERGYGLLLPACLPAVSR